jgi:hypothetical protein
VSWDIGGVRITRVTEFVMPFTFDFFVEAAPADVAAERWLSPDFVDSDGRYLMSLHTFIVETGGLRIVVDTCVGNAKDRPLIPEFDRQDRPFLTDLAAAGFAPETIDLVVCTHLHVDHVGGTPVLSTGCGSRRSHARDTCSRPTTLTSGRIRKIRCTRSLSPIRCNPSSMPGLSTPSTGQPPLPAMSNSVRRQGTHPVT